MTVEPLRAQRRWPFRNTGTRAAVGPAAIVTPNPFVKYSTEMGLIDKHHPVETYRADRSFAMIICLRYPHRSDPGDWLGVEDRAALHQALKDSDEDVKTGRLVDADVILREIKSR